MNPGTRPRAPCTPAPRSALATDEATSSFFRGFDFPFPPSAVSPLPDFAPGRAPGGRTGPAPAVPLARLPRRQRRGEEVSSLGKARKVAARPEAGRRAEAEEGLRARDWLPAALEEAGAQAGWAKCGAADAHVPARAAQSALRAPREDERATRPAGLRP